VRQLKATTEKQAARIVLQEGQIQALTAALKQQAEQIEMSRPFSDGHRGRDRTELMEPKTAVILASHLTGLQRAIYLCFDTGESAGKQCKLASRMAIGELEGPMKSGRKPSQALSLPEFYMKTPGSFYFRSQLHSPKAQ